MLDEPALIASTEAGADAMKFDVLFASRSSMSNSALCPPSDNRELYDGASTLNASQYSVQETLNDGTALTVRAVRPDDKARLVNAFLALEPHSIYARFFHAKTELSEQELRQLTEIDYVSAVVLLATIGARQQETVIGLGRYVGSSRSAEVAFVVEEDYGGRGIAGRLLYHLTHIARENGVAKFKADVLADNAPMLAVFRDSGLAMTTTHADGVVHVTLLLCNGAQAA